jgi:hypothetical protein
MGEVVPEPVREGVHAGLAAAAGGHLVDAGGGQRFPAAGSEPELGAPGLGVAGAGAQVPVQAAGGLVADLEYARHGRSIGGESPLEEEVVLTPSRRQLRRCEAGWEGSPRRIPAPRNTNRV